MTESTSKLLIIGLDGATFDVLGPLMEAGRLPNLGRTVRNGVSGVLHSTVPPITPAAWTTFLTGKQPGSHGIIDFEKYDVRTNRLSLNSTRCLEHVRNIWQILSDKGFKVGSINVPMTYPPIPVNGFMISGFETPGPAADFAYPPELKAEVLKQWSDPTSRVSWRRKAGGGDALFAENVDYMTRSFHQGADMTAFCGDRFGWDTLMVVFKLVDNLQHKTWKYIDPRWSERSPKRRELVFACFEEMDRAVGQLLKYAEDHQARVMIVSDHGHGSLEGKVQPNLLLRRWGYLHLRSGEQILSRINRLFHRATGRTARLARTGDISQDLAVDFSRTRACVMHAGMAGFLYLNLKGRQPTGIVDPADYERTRDELQAKLLGPECTVRDPSGQTMPLFTAVHKPEELYGCSRENCEWLPDLMLIPARPLAVVRKIRGRSPVRWLPYRKLEGTHRPEGIFIAAGAGLKQGEKVEMHMADCAPTILAMMGCPVPADMEGRVVLDLFERAPEVRREAAAAAAVRSSDEEVYSEADLAKITARLADLGYLE